VLATSETTTNPLPTEVAADWYWLFLISAYIHG
jgi:hypothetical protein